MLVVKLLGEFNVHLAGQPIDIPSRPAQTLFAYLVLHPFTAYRREMLAGLIWPDANESNARSNLRHALWRIRKALGEPLGPEVFPSDDLTVAFNPPPDCWIDANLVNGKANTATELAALREAATAYRGELLPGFYDDWITLERERVQLAFEHKMDMLITRLVQTQSWTDTVEWSEHWIKFGNAPEPAFRALMTAHAKLGLKAKVKEDYTRCVEALEREFGVEPSEETQAIYQQLRSTHPLGTSAPARPAPPHNLPAQATPLIGREAELAEITDRLVNDPICRLLTLVGPGGVGKTRLALQVATQALDHFADGAFFVSFEPIATPAAMAATILQKLSPVIHEQKDPHAQVLEYVRDKQLLLVLDNLEHLLEGATLIGEVLSTAAGVKIIVTSRERLHLQWEWLYEVQGLDYPRDDAAIDIEHYSAVQLFLQTARRMRARFSLADEQPHVLHICRLVEGLPLGLELAASWIRVMACREIAQQIERNLAMLSTDVKDVPARHRSLQAVFEYSWNLLSTEEQVALLKLAAFPGGFRREAAERLTSASLSLLFSLADKSLLRVGPTARYDLHPVLRACIGQKLVDSGQRTAIETRIIQYYLEYARQHRHQYADLEEEWTNLMACLAQAQQRWQAQVVLEYVEELSEVWAARGYWSNARQGYAWACAAAQAHDDDRALAFYLRQWGEACLHQSDYAEAQQHLQAAWKLSQQLDDTLGAAKAASELAHIAIEQSDWSLAEELLDGSLSVCEEHHDWPGVAEILYRQARVHYYRSEDALALSAVQRAWSLIANANQHRLSVDVLCMLADIATYSQHDYSQAESYAQQALRLTEAGNDDSRLPSVLVCLADIHRKLRLFPAARQEAERSMVLVKRMGDRKTQAQIWHCLSRIDHNCGQYFLALTENDEGVSLCRELNDRLGEALMLEHRGHILSAIGQPVEARNAWSDALILAEALQHPLTDLLRSYLD